METLLSVCVCVCEQYTIQFLPTQQAQCRVIGSKTYYGCVCVCVYVCVKHIKNCICQLACVAFALNHFLSWANFSTVCVCVCARECHAIECHARECHPNKHNDTGMISVWGIVLVIERGVCVCV